jgi:hypothetical protein
MATSSSLQASSKADSKSYHPPRPRRFAPLEPGLATVDRAKRIPKLRGIIFDVDGTLWYV